MFFSLHFEILPENKPVWSQQKLPSPAKTDQAVWLTRVENQVWLNAWEIKHYGFIGSFVSSLTGNDPTIQTVDLIYLSHRGRLCFKLQNFSQIPGVIRLFLYQHWSRNQTQFKKEGKKLCQASLQLIMVPHLSHLSFHQFRTVPYTPFQPDSWCPHWCHPHPAWTCHTGLVVARGFRFSWKQEVNTSSTV